MNCSTSVKSFLTFHFVHIFKRFRNEAVLLFLCRKSEITSPHALFYQLCSALSFDDSVLLDWLINETSASTFTCYMVKFVKLAAMEFEQFTRELNPADCNVDGRIISAVGNNLCSPPLVVYSSSDESSSSCENYTKSVDDTISCLIRLHLKLERMEANGLLPTSLESLCEAFDQFEEVYEK